MGDVASVTSSSSSYSTVIRALPSRVYSPDSGLSPKRYENILPSCSPSKNTKWSAREPNSTTPHREIAPLLHQHSFRARQRRWATTPLLSATPLRLCGLSRSSIREIALWGTLHRSIYRGVSIIASAEPILVQNPGLHLRLPPRSVAQRELRNKGDERHIANP